MCGDGVTVLLTATIDPGDMGFTRRRDPGARLQDYLDALQWWMRCDGIGRLLFCENSGYDLAPLIELARRENGRKYTPEFFSFRGNDYPIHLGKGYGEVNILKRAVEVFRLSERQEKFLKVTGRYTVENIGKVLECVRRSGDRQMLCNRYKGTYADTRVMFLRPSFLTQYLFPRQAYIRDGEGQILECVMAKALEDARADGVAWTRFDVRLAVSGISGTLDRPYGKASRAEHVVRSGNFRYSEPEQFPPG